MIYTPKEDSLLLAEVTKKYSKKKKVLDLGTGSGFLAKISLDAGAKSVLAADISQEAVEYAKSQGLNAVQSDLFSNINEKFDLIIFNPPYLPFDSREDEESRKITTGGEKGDEILLKFFSQAPLYLNENGVILVVLSSLTPKNRIKNVLNKNNFKFRIVLSKSYFIETLEVWEIKFKP